MISLKNHDILDNFLFEFVKYVMVFSILVNKNANFITKLTKPFTSSHFKPQSGNEMSEAKMLPKMPLGGCRKCKDEAKKSFDVIFMIIVSLLATFFPLFLCE